MSSNQSAVTFSMPLIKPRRYLTFALFYSAFIVYGSLVPLDYTPHPWDEVWQRFLRIPYLDLGAESRADWIANIVLYIPLSAALTAAVTARRTDSGAKLVLLPLVWLTCVLLAFVIEFAQLYFPPRTVSQNDLIAETLGIVAGASLWLVFGGRLLATLAQISGGGLRTLKAVSWLYALAYLALSGFPFDFVTSSAEFSDKLAGGADAWWVSPSCDGSLRCGVSLLSEVVLSAPLGVLLGIALGSGKRLMAVSFAVGILLGVAIESVQFLLVSGIGQGISIVTRGFGMLLGALLHRKLAESPTLLTAIDFRRYVLLAAVPYLALVAYLNGWTMFPRVPAAEAVNEIHWLPFYYHYFTTEAIALTSLLSVLFMYWPIGVALWLWHLQAGRRSGSGYFAGMLAAAAALIIEAGKLFMGDKHPDPSNLLIAFAAAACGYAICTSFRRWLPITARQVPVEPIAAEPAPPESTISASPEKLSAAEPSPSISGKVAALPLLLLVAWKVMAWPTMALPLAVLLAVYVAAMVFNRDLWLIVLPALLPVLNLAPWSGRFFFTEFDCVVLTTVAMGLWLGSWRPVNPLRHPSLLLLFLFSGCYAISTLLGVMPLPALDANAFAGYYSPYNGLRVAKGLLWALLLMPMFMRDYSGKSARYFSLGLLAGLAATILVALWERRTFAGIFDYASDFRITATFFSMHTGGAHLDEYLILTMPFIAWLLLQPEQRTKNLLPATALFVGSLYALLVTFSRAPYFALVVQVALLAGGLLAGRRPQRIISGSAAILPLFLGLGVLVLVPIYQGSFIQSRFQQMDEETDVRGNHWQNTLALMNDDATTWLFGMGTGAFPRTFFWQTADEQSPAAYVLQEDDVGPYLTMTPGKALYVEQIVHPIRDTRYTLTFDYRSTTERAALSLSLCQKAVQHSFDCVEVARPLGSTNGAWRHVEAAVDAAGLLPRSPHPLAGLFQRPIKLVLSLGGSDSAVDVRSLALVGDDGSELLKNGDFAAGFDNWYFSADDHLPWRAENLWVQMLFEQGWLGVGSFMLLLTFLVAKLVGATLRGNAQALLVLTAVAGFLVIGVTDSPFDAPPITLLFFLIAFGPLVTELLIAPPLPSRPSVRRSRQYPRA